MKQIELFPNNFKNIKFKTEINWETDIITELDIYHHQKDLPLNELLINPNFNTDLLEKYKFNLKWEDLSHNSYELMSESFIEKYKDFLHWLKICVSAKLSEKFI